MRLLHIRSILPSDAVYEEPPASAAIRLSPDERFLYVSTRFAEVITVFKIDHGCLAQIQQTGCGGIHPRDMVLTPDGRYLLVANRTRGGLVSFQINPGNRSAHGHMFPRTCAGSCFHCSSQHTI
ncbi:MAG: lactonase family protein [Enterocloster clostridioformis]